MDISKHTFQVKVPSKGAPASRDRALKSRFSTPASLTSVGSCMRRYVLPRHNDGRLALNGRVTISVYSHNMDRNSHGIYRSTAAHSIATTLSVTSSLIRNIWEVTCIDTRAGMRGRVRRRAQRGAVTRKATMVPMSMTAITERTAMCSNVTRTLGKSSGADKYGDEAAEPGWLPKPPWRASPGSRKRGVMSAERALRLWVSLRARRKSVALTLLASNPLLEFGERKPLLCAELGIVPVSCPDAGGPYEKCC